MAYSIGRRRTALALLLMGVLLALSSGCGGSDDAETRTEPAEAADADGPLVIGLVSSHSGYQAPIDSPAERAAKLAADDINSGGGILGRKIKFVFRDAKSDPAQSATGATEVLDKGAEFLIVTCGYEVGGAAARVAQERNILSLSLCASSPAWNSIGPLAYSMTFGAQTEGAVAGGWASEGRLGCSTAFLLVDTLTDYPKSIAEAIKRHYDGEIVGEATFNNGDQSFAAQVSRVQSTNPEPQCIFMPSFPPGGGTLLRQLRAAGIDQPVISAEGFNGEFWIEAIPNLSDFYYTGYASHFGDDPDAEVNDVAKRLQASGDPLSGGTFVSGYSLVEALKIAVERAESFETDSVNAELQQFNEVPLLQGPTTFTKDDRMSLGRAMRIMQVQDGQFSFLEMFEPSGCTASSC